MRWRSPYALSTRATDGQNLDSRTHGAGKAACCRVYACVHSSAVTRAWVCGAFLSGLSARSASPRSTAAIYSRIAIIASQKRSNSAFDSLSVGSIMSVPATGNETVGAWKP